jgi:hypothetical protein
LGQVETDSLKVNHGSEKDVVLLAIFLLIMFGVLGPDAESSANVPIFGYFGYPHITV